MAGKSATLSIKVVTDAKGAKAGFSDAEAEVGKFQAHLDKASVAAGGVLAGVVGIAKEAYDAASALQQSGGAVESIYGRQADAVKAYAADAAEANGLAASAYENSAALIGSQLKSLGFPMGKVADQTDGLIDRASDLAATFGGSTQQAVDALSSALKGERDPIERYGISLTQAAIDAKVAALGLDTHSDAAKRNAQAQAALAIIADQAAASQGSFAREADTAAGQTQRASAEFENAKAALGDVLLPVVADGAQKLAGLAGVLVRNKDVVVPLVTVVGGLAVGILAVNAAMRMYAIVQGIVNAVINASPLMRMVLIITAIVAVVILMYKKFSWFRDLIDLIGKGFVAYIDLWKEGIQWVLDKLSFIGDAAKWVGGLFSSSATMGVSVVPTAGGSLSGMFGAAAVSPAASYGPLYGAPMAALAGGGSTAGQGPRGGGSMTVVNVTVREAIDPVSTGRTLEKILREYATATGSQVTLTIGGKR